MAAAVHSGFIGHFVHGLHVTFHLFMLFLGTLYADVAVDIVRVSVLTFRILSWLASLSFTTLSSFLRFLDFVHVNALPSPVMT